MRTLDIIMPRYNEPWEMVMPYFDMLRCQKGIDFSQVRVLLIHDGTEKFPDECFRDMPCEIVQHEMKHGGVSAARNCGLELATAKWVMFCDCDDTFSGIYALKFAFDVLGTEDFDLLWGGFYTENLVKGKLFLTENANYNNVWIHNKYYRRSFLNENGLRFCERLYFCEDSAFNALVSVTIGKGRTGQIKSPMPMYTWCWRENSATTDPKNKLRNIEGHFDRNLYVLEEFRKRKFIDADLMVGRTLTDAYVNLTRTDYDDDKEPVMKRVREFLLNEKDAIGRIDEDGWKRVMEASVREAKNGGVLNPERPTFTDWINELAKG